MAVRDERDERSEPARPRQSPVSAELQISRPVEGIVADGPPPLRQSAPQQAPHLDPHLAPHPAMPGFAHHHHHHHSPAIGLRVMFATGIVFAVVLPIALQHPEAPRVRDASLGVLLTGMAALKAIATVITAFVVMWRLRRHTTSARRTGYVVGSWLMALGVGLMVSSTLPFYGALSFDAGLVTLLALGATDERLRRGRTR
jgi:hypothetical protein